jgi:phosphoribosylaminoimidazole carboxylase PurK protein
MENYKKTLILGQGQLAWMLETQGRKLGLLNNCLDQPLSNSQLYDFAKTADAIAFESELFDADQIRQKLKKFSQLCFPSLNCLALLQDRHLQKKSLIDNQLPTSPYWMIENQAELFQLIKRQKSLVAKKRQGGYDGYGTTLLKNLNQAKKFLKENPTPLTDFIFEKLIPFQEERALQVARSRSGHIQFFPMVLTVQKDKKCFYVVGPLKTPPELAKKISRWLNQIDYVGVMGIEFFHMDGKYLINEVAPRVHNTGHHTLDSCHVDQFTMHWLCRFQDKLPQIELKAPAFIMLNLIGKSLNPVLFPEILDGSLYWYNKSNRPGRKLGHINWVGNSKKALLKRAFLHLKKWKL